MSCRFRKPMYWKTVPTIWHHRQSARTILFTLCRDKSLSRFGAISSTCWSHSLLGMDVSQATTLVEGKVQRIARPFLYMGYLFWMSLLFNIILFPICHESICLARHSCIELKFSSPILKVDTSEVSRECRDWGQDTESPPSDKSDSKPKLRKAARNVNIRRSAFKDRFHKKKLRHAACEDQMNLTHNHLVRRNAIIVILKP